MMKGTSRFAHSGASTSSSSQLATAFNNKTAKPFKDYFDNEDDDDDEQDDGESNHRQSTTSKGQIEDDDDEVDPLDAFMAGVHATVKKEETTIKSDKDVPPEIVSYNDDDDLDYYAAHMAGSSASIDGQGDPPGDVDYDSDGLPVGNSRKPLEKSVVEPLPAVNHKTISYAHFKKNFYKEHPMVAAMSDMDVSNSRDSQEISVIGSNVPKPIQQFEQAGFEGKLLKEILRVGFEKPTAIQSQTLPAVLSGRDIIGLAKTGSGKTLTFVWPMIVHILDQPAMRQGDGPIALILAPTRELASQIFSEAKKFCKVFDIAACPIFGGSGKWEMTKALKESPEVVVATPGRLIDLVKSKATTLTRATYVVLDEADRMFEMGFEYQMRSIVNNIRPDRQTLLFSATMKKKVEGFAREILTDPLRIVIGSIGQANPDIKQLIEVVRDNNEKWQWLKSHADEFVAEGKLLIFVLSKSGTEEVADGLRKHFISRQLDIGVECLHGDKDQSDRQMVVRKFSKTTETAILVATDIAARGLDIKDIRTVVNYDIAKNIETYVHRIGRTGRMGIDGVVPGTAYTLLTPHDGSFAVDLVGNLKLSGQPVSASLERLASSDPKWNRINGGKGGKSYHAGGSSGVAGLGSAGRAAAMTSEMLANQGGSFVQSSHYSKLMGNSSDKGATDTQPSNTLVAGFVPSSSQQPQFQVHAKPPSVPLPGFVSARTTGTPPVPVPVTMVSAVQQPSQLATNSDALLKKRSRWDM